MKKSKLFFLLCTILVLFSCGDSDSELLKDEAHTYRVVFEVIGTDYTAEANVLNADNVPLYDETEHKDLKQASVSEEFTEKNILYNR